MNSTIRRWLLAGALTIGAWTAADMLTDDDAQAAPKPRPAAEQPTAAPDRPHQLPDRASKRAKAVVAGLTGPDCEPAADKPPEPEPQPSEDQAEPQPEPSTPPRDEQPAPEPTQGPADTPTEPRRDEPTPPADLPIDLPPVIDVPPVELPPVEAPPLPPVEVPPAPPVVDLPPLPLPTEPAPTSEPEPEPEPQPEPAPAPQPDRPTSPTPAAATPAAGTLPVVIGPTPADHLEVPAPPMTIEPAATAEATEPCGTDTRPDTPQGQRDNADRQIGKPSPSSRDQDPCKPAKPTSDPLQQPQVKPPPPSVADLAIADVTGSHVAPVLARLEHARARAHLPTSRHTAIEPGPA